VESAHLTLKGMPEYKKDGMEIFIRVSPKGAEGDTPSGTIVVDPSDENDMGLELVIAMRDNEVTVGETIDFKGVDRVERLMINTEMLYHRYRMRGRFKVIKKDRQRIPGIGMAKPFGRAVSFFFIFFFLLF